MDDLVIPVVTEAEGLDKLQVVLKTAKDYGLQLNWSKSEIFNTKIEFLGHQIENGQIRPGTENRITLLRAGMLSRSKAFWV